MSEERELVCAGYRGTKCNGEILDRGHVALYMHRVKGAVSPAGNVTMCDACHRCYLDFCLTLRMLGLLRRWALGELGPNAMEAVRADTAALFVDIDRAEAARRSLEVPLATRPSVVRANGDEAQHRDLPRVPADPAARRP